MKEENGDDIIIFPSDAEDLLSSSSPSAASDEPGCATAQESPSPFPILNELDERQGDAEPADEPAPATPWLDELTS